jgi:hypothetical protein
MGCSCVVTFTPCLIAATSRSVLIFGSTSTGESKKSSRTGAIIINCTANRSHFINWKPEAGALAWTARPRGASLPNAKCVRA